MQAVGQRHASAALPPVNGSITHCIEGWVGPTASLKTSAVNLACTGIRSQDLAPRSESRLSTKVILNFLSGS